VLSMVKKRLVQLLLVLFLLSFATFVLMKLAPGDPVLRMLQFDEMPVTQTDEQNLRAALGFDQPVLIQYGQWLSNLLRLDLGHSYLDEKPVWDTLLERLGPTLQLTAGGMLVMLLIAAPLGIMSAMYSGQWPDQLSRVIALIGASIPSFWLGLLLMFVFSYQLQWLPTMGKGGLKHLLLPSVTLGLAMGGVYARLLRAGLLESLSQEYIRAARARGVAEWRLMIHHAFRSALLPVLTVFGMSLSSLLAGTMVIEVMFSWPGLGLLAVEAIYQRDYPVLQGYVLFTGASVVVIHLLVDMGCALLDPRIRFGKGRET